MPAVTIPCRCGTVHRDVPKPLWGRKTRCNVCGRSIRVPAPEPSAQTLDELFEEFARSLAEPRRDERPRRVGRYQLGRLAVRTRLATPGEVDLAVGAQTWCRELGVIKRLGDVLVEQGVLQPADVDRLLALQRHKIACLPTRDAGEPANLNPLDSRVARVLVESGLLEPTTVDDCARALGIGRSMGFEWSLADVFVERGVLDRDLVDRIHAEQERQSQVRVDAPGLEQVAPFRLRSAALARAYADAEPEAREPRRSAVRTVPRSRRVFGTVAGAILLASLGLPAAFLSNRAERGSTPRTEVRAPRRGPADPVRLAQAQARRPWSPAPRADAPPEGAPAAADLLENVPEEGLVARVERGRDGEVYLLVAGRTSGPGPAEIPVVLESKGRVADQRRGRIGPTGEFRASFGPYRSDLPDPDQAAADPWLPAGRYRIVARAAQVDLLFPDEESMAGAVRAQAQATRSFLDRVHRDAAGLASELDRLAGEILARGVDPSDAGRIDARRAAASASKSRLDRFRAVCVAAPDPVRFGEVAALHDAVLRFGARLGEAIREPSGLEMRIAPLRDEVRDLATSLYAPEGEENPR